MADQLRWDYLSCYGNTKLHTPNIDRIAKMGVRFNRAYVQSPICGPSRMSFYTGRYVRSHGSTWNGIPLRIGEQTLGDHLRELEVSCVLVGKTHMVADAEGMKRLGIEPDSFIGVRVKECGFEVFERDEDCIPMATTTPIPDMTITCARMAWMVIIPGRNGPILRKAAMGSCCPVGLWKMRICRRVCRRSIRKQRI